MRAQLMKATASPPPADVATASAMLRLLLSCPLPALVHGSQASLVEELQKHGLLQAEFAYTDSPEEDMATVLAITAKGREALTTGVYPSIDSNYISITGKKSSAAHFGFDLSRNPSWLIALCAFVQCRLPHSCEETHLRLIGALNK